MQKRTKQAVDLWITRAIARAKYAALTGATFGDVIRAAIARKSPPETTLANQLTDFLRSLRSDQVSALIGVLDIQQKLAFMEVANTATKIVEPHDVRETTQRQAQTGPEAAVK